MITDQGRRELRNTKKAKEINSFNDRVSRLEDRQKEILKRLAG